MTKCVASLVKHALCEAPGKALWISLLLPRWGGEDLPAAQLTSAHIHAGGRCGALDSSAGQPLATPANVIIG